MKDSGIEWIGEIPEHWKIIKIKWLLSERKERSEEGSEEPLSMSQKYGIIPTKDMEMIPNMATSFVGAKLVRSGDLVFNKLKAHLGVFSVSKYSGLVSPDYAVYSSTTESNAKFLEFLFKTPQYINEFKKKSSGVGAGLTRLYTSDLYSIYCGIPPISEQQKIAEYLEMKYTAIRRVIFEIEQVIEKLKEYRQSIITEAVTKGLHNVPMTDSGVEWIGEIPEHWNALKIKYIFRERIEENNDPSQTLLSLFASIGVRPRSEMEDKGNKAQTIIGYSIVKKGDIVVNRLLAWMGAIGLSNYDGVTSPDYDVYTKITDNISESYYHYLFRSAMFKDECYKYGRGIMLMRLRTYPQDFKNIVVPLPSIEEQQEIAEYLDKKCAAVDKLIVEKEQVINKLDEYKKSLIYEYVTGKKEVLA